MRTRAAAFAYVLLCAGLWMVPLLRILHAESSAFVAGAAFGVGGWAALDAFGREEGYGRVLRRHLLLLVVPWALLTATLLWTPNRGYGQGLLLFVAFAPPSAALGVSLAWALAAGRHPRRRFVLVALALLVATPLYDLGLHPQFYHYNHVFGGILGPIYDEELALRPGLFAFRGLTLLWAAALFGVGEWRRGRREGGRLVALGFLIALTYAGGGWLGLNTPLWRLRAALEGHRATAHFDLYYDPSRLSAREVERAARLHEWRYAQLRDALAVEVDGRIQSFLYPDAATRAALTGARETSVAPVWLATPQMHLPADRLDEVLGHELAHVFSRPFGLPVVHASRLVGLVEGFAVAAEPPDGLPSPHEQVLAAAGALDAAPPAAALAASLGAGGFWTGRGAVSYTTTGSFVRYLLDAYGADAFRRVYAWGDFEGVYGKPVTLLADEWWDYLLHLDRVALAAGPLAVQRFTAPSLFEQASPHWVPPYRRGTRRALAALARGDTLAARAGLDRVLGRWPAYAPALDAWAALALARGDAPAVRARLDTLADAPPVLSLRLGDARALAGDATGARQAYQRAIAALPAYAHDAAVMLALRARGAGAPRAIRAAYGGPAPPDTGAAAMLHALRLLPRQPGAAYRLLAAHPVPRRAWPTPGAYNRYLAQRQGWLADAALASGAWPAARAHARAAARLFSALGDWNAAARWRDSAAQAAWAQQAPSSFR